MKLDFIDLGKLAVSRTNMRYARKAPDVSDILPTIRKRGVLVPLIIRPAPNDSDESAMSAFEIVAGARRFTAASIVAAETGHADPLPCAILEAGDDADAIEASLIENVARRDADEVTQWESYARLVREGRSIAEIADTFGMPEAMVRRILALGNLLPRIRSLYARERINAATVRLLTLASKSQQRAWLELFDDGAARCPHAHQLKAWLLGGGAILVGHALFDVEASGLAVVADLFGEDRYFSDAQGFWAAQEAAIAERRDAYLDAGWPDVVILPRAEHFAAWEYRKAPKRKGGRVYIETRGTGETIFHEGYVTAKEAARLERGERIEAATRAARPERTQRMRTYIDLHRHAAVRAELTAHPHVALRLMVAHAIAGSPLWQVRVDPQSARDEDVRESVETCRAEAVFDERRRAILNLLGFAPEEPTVTGGDTGFDALFRRLLDLPERVVLDVIAIVMGETLAVGSPGVALAGLHLGVDMAAWWEADAAFLEGLRDREVLSAILAEVGGEAVAAANAKAKGATLKAIIRDCLDGANGRAKVERWVPRWMAFPPAAYTARGGDASGIGEDLVSGAVNAADGTESQTEREEQEALEADTEPQREAA